MRKWRDGKPSDVDHVGAGLSHGRRVREHGRNWKGGRINDFRENTNRKTREVLRLPATPEIGWEIAQFVRPARHRHAELVRETREIGAAAAGQDNTVRGNRASQAAHDNGFGHQGCHLHPGIADLPAERGLAHGPHQPVEARIGKMAGEKEKAFGHATVKSLLRRATNSFSSLRLSATCVASKVLSFSVFSRSIRRGKTFTMPSGERVKSSGAVSQAKKMEGTRHLPAWAKTLLARLSEIP